ncbi:MAG: Fe(2+)-trafficking protein [Phycisphaerales bacterium]|nr:MAG: Fe(2+)-trafficking protein [Phycisphaerales bacterium]
MSDLEERIAQFEKMAQADPDNDMAHFSLGNALLQAERFEDAAASLLRCLELNQGMSKAFQLAGEALIKADRADEAIDVLMAGYVVAARKGDMMPRNAITDLLRSIGQEPPEVEPEEPADAQTAAGGGQFVCQRTGRAGTQLPDPPMRGPLGQWIYENISAETWKDWIGQGTKVINELRLDFSRERDQEVYEQHMCEFLGIEPELHKKLTAKS